MAISSATPFLLRRRLLALVLLVSCCTLLRTTNSQQIISATSIAEPFGEDVSLPLADLRGALGGALHAPHKGIEDAFMKDILHSMKSDVKKVLLETAEANNPGGGFREHSACVAESEKLCAGARSAMHCLGTKVNEVSEACKSEVKHSIPFVCSLEITNLKCDGMDRPILGCLTSNEANLGGACSDSLRLTHAIITRANTQTVTVSTPINETHASALTHNNNAAHPATGEKWHCPAEFLQNPEGGRGISSHCCSADPSRLAGSSKCGVEQSDEQCARDLCWAGKGQWLLIRNPRAAHRPEGGGGWERTASGIGQLPSTMSGHACCPAPHHVLVEVDPVGLKVHETLPVLEQQKPAAPSSLPAAGDLNSLERSVTTIEEEFQHEQREAVQASIAADERSEMISALQMVTLMSAVFVFVIWFIREESKGAVDLQGLMLGGAKMGFSKKPRSGTTGIFADDWADRAFLRPLDDAEFGLDEDGPVQKKHLKIQEFSSYGSL